MKGKVFIAEDEEIMRITLCDALTEAGFLVEVAEDGEKALTALLQDDFELVIADLRMPGCDGLTMMKRLRKKGRDIPFIMITAYGTVQTAVSAMKEGALDFITKPFHVDELIAKAEKAILFGRLKRENLAMRMLIKERSGISGLVGDSPSMREVIRLIRNISELDITVLVYGETGTGKGLIAGVIHDLSPRKEGPFVEVGCAALPPTLVESELFGHERGAFTGAVGMRKGKFEMADGGTILLDDIDDLPLEIQKKLLRVLEDGRFERIGGGITLGTDVRIISTSKVDLEEKVKEGRFREDLFYRLNVTSINLPPLRERLEDIPLLVNHFIEHFSTRYNRRISGCTYPVMEALLHHNWPGNVRELAHVIERMVALCRSEELGLSDLPEYLRKIVNAAEGESHPFPGITPLKDFLEKCEEDYIRKILKVTSGKKGEASRLLGISRKTLWEKLNK